MSRQPSFALVWTDLRVHVQKLASIGVRATVRHAQYTSPGVFEAKMDLIVEFVTVNRTASPASPRWIAGLEHEIWNDSMKDDIAVVVALSEGHEILARLLGYAFYL